MPKSRNRKSHKEKILKRVTRKKEAKRQFESVMAALKKKYELKLAERQEELKKKIETAVEELQNDKSNNFSIELVEATTTKIDKQEQYIPFEDVSDEEKGG